MKRLERLTSLLTILQSKKHTGVMELIDRFGVSERTVFRDLRALQESGVPIAFEKDKGYFILDRHFLPPLSFTLDEARSFIFVEQLAKKYTDATTHQHFSTALEKIRNKLKDHQLDDVELLQEKVKAYIDQEYTPQYLSIVEHACVDKTILKLVYKDVKGQSTERTVEPIGITFYSQSWHLIAYCQMRNDYRDFSLSRIVQLQTTHKTYQREHLTLAEYIQKLEAEEND